MFGFMQFCARWSASVRRRGHKPKRVHTRRPGLECLEDRLVPSTFTVTNNNSVGPGSLYQAIVNSNAATGQTNTINFSVGDAVDGLDIHNDIKPTEPLPAITNPVVIDGTTNQGAAPGLPNVVLDGLYAAPYHESVNGLTIDCSGCTVRGLIVIGWTNDGIDIASGNNNFIEGCTFGLASELLIANGSTGSNNIGVQVGSGSNSDVIGGASSTDRNLFGDNYEAGIELQGSGTNVFNNYIGSTRGGNEAENGEITDLTFPNGTGIIVSSSSDNLINDNVVSGNTLDAISVRSAASTGNFILNNSIGLDTQGLYAIAGNGPGIVLSGGPNNNQINGNTIVASNGNGVELTGTGTNDNTVDGNYIGILPGTPQDPIGNTGDGVLIRGGAQDNTVGSATSPNVISANPYLTATATNLSTHDTSEVSTTLESGLSASGLALTSTVGVPFSGTVASFTPGYSGEPLGNFNATIQWGDGRTSTGTVVQGVNNTYNVVGTHTYASPGSLLPVVVSIQDVPGNTTVTANSTMTVTAGLTGVPKTVQYTAGISNAAAVVASFFDTNPTAFPGLYTATIDWGDEAVNAPPDTSTGTVVADGNGFDVLGTHTYATPGNYTITVTIQEPNGESVTINSTAVVGTNPYNLPT